MFSKKMAALVAASLVVATTPAVAQTAPAPVADARVGAEMAGENELAGGGFWAAVLGIALLAAFILVIIEDDDIDLPTSP